MRQGAWSQFPRHSIANSVNLPSEVGLARSDAQLGLEAGEGGSAPAIEQLRFDAHLDDVPSRRPLSE